MPIRELRSLCKLLHWKNLNIQADTENLSLSRAEPRIKQLQLEPMSEGTL